MRGCRRILAKVRYRERMESSPAPRVSSALRTVGRVVLVATALAVVAVTTWILVALGRTAQDGGVLVDSSALPWVLALLLVIGLPLALVVWRHGRRPAALLAMPTVALASNALLLGGLVGLTPDPVGAALRMHGSWVVFPIAGETTPTRVMAGLSHRVADAIDPHATVPPPRPARPQGTLDGGLSIPLDRHQTSLRVPVQLVGPKGQLDATYLFDTGATFTTISHDAASRLGIEVPDDAPRHVVHTAAGPRETALVYLPALRIGGVELAGLSASICDACVQPHAQGLLGLNVMRGFVSHLDHGAGRLVLEPATGPHATDRTRDIAELVELSLGHEPQIWAGHIRWVVHMTNRSTQVVEGARAAVRFTDGTVVIGAALPDAAPGTTVTGLIEGDVPSQRQTFDLELAHATW